MNTNKTDFYLDQLSQLINGKVTQLCRTGVDEDFGDEFFGLVFTMPDGNKKTLIIMRDDEGNGPGSFEIQ